MWKFEQGRVDGVEVDATIQHERAVNLISTQVIVDKGSICGWARRNRRNPREKALSKRIAEKGGLGGGLAAAAASAKKRKKVKKKR